jgi:DNA-binding transcriptional ArsR family regulator
MISIYKSNIQILKTLKDNNYTSPFKSATVSQLQTIIPYSQSKLSKDLNALTTANLTLRGMKISRAETFYISQQGITYLSQILNELQEMYEPLNNEPLQEVNINE